MLLAFLASFGQTYFIGIFAGEIRQTFNLSHGQWGGIYTLGTAASAIVMIQTGALADCLRVRLLGSATLVLLALACTLMALVSSVWTLALVIFALRLTGQGMTMHTAVVAMSRWFVASRGKAISIATLGGNAGEAILPLLFTALMVHYQWRLLWIIAALIVLIAVPVLLGLLMRETTPVASTESDASAGMENRHWTRNEAFGHWLFWFMVPALIGPAFFSTAFFFHQVHFAAIKDWQHLDLVALFPGYMAVMVGAIAMSGWLMDKTGSARLIPWLQVPMVAGFTLFSQGDTLFLVFLGMVFMALTTGANTVIPNAFWPDFYGTRNLGAIKAMAVAIMVFGTALGPGLSGLLIDLGVGLEVQFQIGALYFVITTVLMKHGVTRAMKLRERPFE